MVRSSKPRKKTAFQQRPEGMKRNTKKKWSHSVNNDFFFFFLTIKHPGPYGCSDRSEVVGVTVHRPVSFKEVGLGDVLPPDDGLDALRRHSSPEQRDVLRVRRLERCVFEEPETAS